MQTELILLPSSPVPAHSIGGTVSSPTQELSSDDLPSPSTLLTRRGVDKRLKSGSRVVEIPENASLGFQRLSALYSPKSLSVEANELESMSNAEATEARKPSKQKTNTQFKTNKTTLEHSKPDKTPKIRSKRASAIKSLKTQNKDLNTEKFNVNEKPKRSRKKKAVPEADAQPLSDKENKCLEVEANPDFDPDRTIDLTVEDETVLAVKRKTRWTPPRRASVSIGEVEDPAQLGESSDPIVSPQLDNFTFRAKLQEQPTTTADSNPQLFKRKRIELVQEPSNLIPKATESPVRSRLSPKKKLRTITAFATERFRPQQLEDEVPRVSDLFGNILESPTTDPAKTSPARTKGRRKRTDVTEIKSTKTKSTKKTKAVAEKPNLLSPTAATIRTNGQDLLFGTSSQLALEHTQYLRDLQSVLRESATGGLGLPDFEASRFKSRVTVASNSRGLWSAGALCSDDNEFNIEAARIQLDRETTRLDMVESFPEMVNEFVDIDQITELERSEAQVIPEYSFTSVTTPTTSFDSLSTSQMPLTTSVTTATSASVPSNVDHIKSPARTKYFGLPIEAPAKRPRGKPRKNVATTNRVESKGLTKTSISAGTPEKMKIMAVEENEFRDIDEILDSEPDNTPSPPRLQAQSQPLILENESSALTAKGNPRKGYKGRLKKPVAPWGAVREKVFQLITTVIKSLPPSGNPSHPNWHEKILLYEPVILEDLCQWLRAQGIRVPASDPEDVGAERRTRVLEPWMVRQWCDAKSVCCASKQTQRGGDRKAYMDTGVA